MSDRTPAPAAVDLPAEAPVGVSRVVRGPRVTGRVLGAFPSAVYVGLPSGEVVGVVSSDGVDLPLALVVRPTSAERPFAGIAAGGEAVVGEGRLEVGRLRVHAARWSDRLRPRLGTTTPTQLAEAAAELHERRHTLPAHPQPDLAGRVEDLLAELSARRTVPAAEAAQRLVGLGPGLTPSGDDVLAGVLAGSRAFAAATGDVELDRLTLAVRDRLVTTTVTTSLSACLLDHAGRGAMAGVAGRVAVAMARGRALGPALDRLLVVGHTSGRDLAHGLEVAALVAARRSHLRRPAGAVR